MPGSAERFPTATDKIPLIAECFLTATDKVPLIAERFPTVTDKFLLIAAIVMADVRSSMPCACANPANAFY